ncbi:hydroxymethylpyrimidine/phosphomethylpyrimidine kinase [Nitrosomonas sp. PY1]|uniref:bifunctional hydroxymethylpyrimidine kinase/phosphomethylpyrimidine kinase n=1 Tax=Nitrosomonas sp. PY1 TaxID=1803906 RepID=UPI001FC8EA3A|nr:hydroxymethylpyrimidine/phosphomethylpyrimidine kinase [Nitrosomonas sp. PY1]GKS69144.1 hydroxymethylpyrimidine/phosphomethylpyrimidine kinase [Nitrosomonas sp. PY1]
MLQPPPIVLSFAASDPTGGAGIQADMLTIAGIGCHPLSVITAITIQDTTGVVNLMPLDATWITAQAQIVLQDMPVRAFKLGLLGSIEIIAAIAEIVLDYPEIPLVMDPVLASGRGDQLTDERMIDAMRELLLPRVTVLTPNSLEARRLAQHESDCSVSQLDLSICAQRLLNTGCKHVLITGTHENSHNVKNTLYSAAGIRTDEWERLDASYHGSGCTLASAIAAQLAQGSSISDSIVKAQQYTWQTLRAGFRPGRGQYIPDRLFRIDEQKEANSDKETPTVAFLSH